MGAEPTLPTPWKTIRCRTDVLRSRRVVADGGMAFVVPLRLFVAEGAGEGVGDDQGDRYQARDEQGEEGDQDGAHGRASVESVTARGVPGRGRLGRRGPGCGPARPWGR